MNKKNVRLLDALFKRYIQVVPHTDCYEILQVGKGYQDTHIHQK